ncbi:hypothetical protein SLEP1_g2844 [Rubroshorea leprosula]|uniref:Uncharacterized protein n=1 Tax=Rubroshorea leprosula TaxID=152421 RepID=A0AAV5HTU7_9ROSI|nr:hypothetical protein SLEP1_g2844 [Rubroshorea leprosula]
MADEEIGSMLNRVRLSEDENGILPLHSIWKLDEPKVEKLRLMGKILSRKKINMNGLHDALMVSFSSRHKIAGNQEHYETIANVASQVEGHNDHAAGDLEANNNVTSNASQMEGHNAIGVGEIADETVQPLPTTVRELASAGNMEHVDGLPGLMSDQLVEIPLALGFDGIEQLPRHENGAKGGRGKWKQIECEVGSSVHMEKLTQGKRKGNTASLAEQRANKVLLNNTWVALILGDVDGTTLTIQISRTEAILVAVEDSWHRSEILWQRIDSERATTKQGSSSMFSIHETGECRWGSGFSWKFGGGDSSGQSIGDWGGGAKESEGEVEGEDNRYGIVSEKKSRGAAKGSISAVQNPQKLILSGNQIRMTGSTGLVPVLHLKPRVHTAEKQSQVKPDHKHRQIGTTGRSPNSIKSSRERSSPTATLPDRPDSLGIKREKLRRSPKRGVKNPHGLI